MAEIHDAQGMDAKIGQAVQVAVMMAQIEVPVIESLSVDAIKGFIKARLEILRTLGGLTQEEAQTLKAQLDGATEATSGHLSVFGTDGRPSLAGLLGQQLATGATHSAAGAYVAAMAGIGAAVIGMGVCGTPCAITAAWQAGAITASIKSS